MSRSGLRGNSSRSQLPMGRDSKSKSSPLQKLTAIFKKERNNGSVPVPAIFANDKRSESPEPEGRSNSVGKSTAFKIRRDKPSGSRPLWKSIGRCNWESDSGRQLTLQDTPVSELSKVEIQMLQRIAVNKLQEREIPVSHSMVKSIAGNRNMLGRLSFNTFNKKPPRKISTSSDKIDAGGGVFGKPLTAVCESDQVIRSSTPGTPGGRRVSSPSSPTSSENSSCVEETNPTTALLEALSSNAAPSPQTVRRQSLLRADPQVPLIVRKAIAHLDTNGVKTEGLFRVSGAKSRIAEIRGKIDSGDDIELGEDTNPHDVACLLKEFLRNLPEPLLTKELYQPFLATRKFENPGSRRDMLRLLCILLPQPNRDTLQELLQFLSRVALRSNGIILIDGSVETGNRMTEQNLATILGPNLLHKESKSRKSSSKSDFQFVKQDAEELASVCKVMEDLIRMHSSIFMVSAELLNAMLKALLDEDPQAVEQLLKRKCIEMGLFLPQQEGADNFSEEGGSLHDRSLMETQQSLEEAILNLEKDLDQELYLCKTQHYSSNDSAMGGSEAVLSPLLEGGGGGGGGRGSSSNPGTMTHKHMACDSMDSAFSNASSPTAFGDRGGRDPHDHDDDDVMHMHNRMSSEASGISSTSSPEPRKLSQFSSMPTLRLSPDPVLPVSKCKSSCIDTTNYSYAHYGSRPPPNKRSHNKLSWRTKKTTSFEGGFGAPPHSIMATSPILRSREAIYTMTEDPLAFGEAVFLDRTRTPTESTSSVCDFEDI